MTILAAQEVLKVKIVKIKSNWIQNWKKSLIIIKPQKEFIQIMMNIQIQMLI